VTHLVSVQYGLTLLCLAFGCRSASTELRHAPTGDAHETVTLGQRPYGLALSPSEAFVTQLDGRTVSRLSLSDLSVTGSALPVGSVPTSAALSPDGALLLVADQQDGVVSLLQTSPNDARRTTLGTDGNPYRVLFAPDGKRAYATTSAGYLVVIDVAARQVIASVSTGLGPINGIAFSPDGAALYLSSTSGGVATVDPRTNAVLRTYPLAGQLQDIVPSPEGDKLYVADERAGVVALSLASGAAERLPAPGAFGLGLSNGGAKLWVTQPLAGKLTIVDRVTGVALRQIVLNSLSGFIPRRVGFDRRGAAVVTDEAGFVHVFR
jgi:YVTN family beta-propeller protein